MAIKYIDEADLKGKKVIARFDFNVPLDSHHQITDTTRIDESLPTIRYILEKGASKLIMMSHLGRPKAGKFAKEFSLEPVAKYLASKLEQEIVLSESSVDSGVKSLLTLNETKIVLLENIRFHKEETDNDLEFAKKLASYADIYVNDAFGTSHREHASVYGITKYFEKKSYGGFLLKREVEALSKIMNSPKKPFVTIIGGSKISDKIKTLEYFITHADKVLVGGAMSYPFLAAKNIKVGKSRCAKEDVEFAKKALAQDVGKKILLPVDHLVSEQLDGKPIICNEVTIPDNLIGLDIGPKSIELYTNEIKKAKTVFWNGPMGLFENPNFSKGTFAIARAMADIKSQAYTVVGGGDSVSAVNSSGLADQMSHISTGGGASLELIEEGDLPGLFALKFGPKN